MEGIGGRVEAWWGFGSQAVQLQHAAPRARQHSKGCSLRGPGPPAGLARALAGGEAVLLLMQQVQELAGADASSFSSFCSWP